MTRLLPLNAALLALALVPAAGADTKDDGFKPLFNGKDLTGWVRVNCHPDTFYVKDNEIITTGKPMGFLRTDRQYENFIAEFDWMHIPYELGKVGNSGFFVWGDPVPAVGTVYTRGIEVQVLVNLTYKNKKGEITATSQGDLFSIWGATCVPDRPHPDGWARCLPSGDYCKGEREWNHYRVEANDGRITLAVNGHVVSGVSKCNPRKGYLALESEGSECHFRNLKIKELPSTTPKPEEVVDVAKGFVSLFDGLDLAGWKDEAEAKKHWQVRDSKLMCDGQGEKGQRLGTAKEYGDCELMADWRFPAKKGADADSQQCGVAFLDGDKGAQVSLPPSGAVQFHQVSDKGTSSLGLGDDRNEVKARGQWNRIVVRKKGRELTVTLNGKPAGHQTLKDALGMGPIALFGEGGPVDFTNVFVRELKE
jgi:Domain of Unknown Function (DUF1080)